MTALLLALVLAQNRGSVEGAVLNALTNAPLRKAEVKLDVGSKTLTVISGGDGTFKLENIEPGSYFLRVERQGFLDPDEVPIEIAAGQRVKDTVVRMTPQSIAAGHVVDEDGDPVESALVKIERSVQINGHKVSFGSDEERTNSEGYFFIGGLQSGRYRISASPPPATFSPREALARTEHPSPLQFAPGEAKRDIEIRLRKAAVFRVSGKVPDRPASMPPLHLVSETEDYITNVHRDGSFSFESVEAGDYTLTIEILPRTTTLFCHVPVTVSDRDVEGIEAPLTTGATVEGTIKMDGDAPFTAPPFLQLIGNFQTTSVVTKDGAFQWKNLAPKMYFIDYAPPDGDYIKSIRFNHQPITGLQLQLDLTSGIGGTLEIVVAPRAASLAVSIEGGKKAQVALWNDLTLNSWETTGTASFEHLAPGEYRILAWENVEQQLIYVPDFRALFEAQKITLNENAHESIVVKVIPKSAIDAETAKLQ